MIGCPLLSRPQNSVGVDTPFEDPDEVVVIGLTDIIPTRNERTLGPVTVHPNRLMTTPARRNVNPLKVLLK